jgi:hypothetical protein
MPAKKTATASQGGRGGAPAKKKTTRKRGPAAPRGPEPLESAIDLADDSVAELAKRVTEAGGATLAAFKDPYGGLPLLFVSLPLRSIEATEFQRDLSKVHADRLSDAIGAVGVFLDPVIAVAGKNGFTSPNGRHRLAAAKKLGQRTVTALVVADPWRSGLPLGGFVRLRDAETGRQGRYFIGPPERERYREAVSLRERLTLGALLRSGVRAALLDAEQRTGAALFDAFGIG